MTYSEFRSAERKLLIGVSVICLLNTLALLMSWYFDILTASRFLQLAAVYTLPPAVIIAMRTEDLMESAKMLFAGMITSGTIWFFGFFV